MEKKGKDVRVEMKEWKGRGKERKWECRNAR